MRNYEILPADVSLENENKILTKRELEILILIAAGFENHQIAKVFLVTLSTVKKQIERIYFKLKAKNRANAVFIVQFQGLITPRDYAAVMNSKRIREFIESTKTSKND